MQLKYSKQLLVASNNDESIINLKLWCQENLSLTPLNAYSENKQQWIQPPSLDYLSLQK